MRLTGLAASVRNRRKAFVSVTPAEGGFLVNVEAYKELEDVAGVANSAGAATFLDNNARARDLEAVVGQTTKREILEGFAGDARAGLRRRGVGRVEEVSGLSRAEARAAAGPPTGRPPAPGAAARP